jgi:hypothetical protein
MKICESFDFTIIIQILTLVVLVGTLGAIIWYSIETYKMRKFQQRNYKESITPLLSIQINEGNKSEYHSVFVIVNHKPVFTRLRVFANAKMAEQPKNFSDHYNGKIEWLIQPSSVIHCPFTIPQILGCDSGSVQSYSENPLTLEVILDYKSDAGISRRNPPVKYCYDFNKRNWVLDVGA